MELLARTRCPRQQLRAEIEPERIMKICRNKIIVSGGPASCTYLVCHRFMAFHAWRRFHRVWHKSELDTNLGGIIPKWSCRQPKPCPIRLVQTACDRAGKSLALISNSAGLDAACTNLTPTRLSMRRIRWFNGRPWNQGPDPLYNIAWSRKTLPFFSFAQ